MLNGSIVANIDSLTYLSNRNLSIAQKLERMDQHSCKCFIRLPYSKLSMEYCIYVDNSSGCRHRNFFHRTHHADFGVFLWKRTDYLGLPRGRFYGCPWVFVD
jgi:hypothetical protein